MGIRELRFFAGQFRQAIEAAKNAGRLNEQPFWRFPRACCGDASELLAQYLLEHGIHTNCVTGNYYGNNAFDTQPHEWLEVQGNIIIDITGDQFCNNPTPLRYSDPCYVGPMDNFHKLFEVRPQDRYVFYGLQAFGNSAYLRLSKLYDIIIQYIDS